MLDKFKLYRNNEHHQDINILDKSTLRVIVFASIVIVISILMTGGISYFIAQNAVINKLKTSDLVYIARSVTAKIDGRIGRAKEVAEVLAKDPAIMKWIADGEKDEMLGLFAKQKITDIAKYYDYSNSFIVSAVTKHYWAEGGKLIDTMSQEDEDDSWFFDTIASKQPVAFNIDYNKERGDTFVFVNALMGNIDDPIAVTGVGLNLKDISKEFQGYKFGEKSNMWLVDSNGEIYLSEDVEQVTLNIRDLIPGDVAGRILSSTNNSVVQDHVMEYQNEAGQKYDMIYQTLVSTDWKLVLQIPRKESEAIIYSIRTNTGIACVVAILSIMIAFYMISNKIADPYKRAVLLNQELERKVEERTKELNEKNIKIMDSIEYAKMIQ